MGNRDVQIVMRGQFGLQIVRLSPRTTSITATAIGENDQFVGILIAILTDCRPPLFNTVNGKFWGVFGSTNIDRSLIMPQVVNPVWHGNTVGIRTKVVIVHVFWLLTPLAACIVKSANQFFLLCVHTDDRNAFGRRSLAQFSDQRKLTVAVWMTNGCE